MARLAPSGKQIEIVLGDQRAVVVGVGGGLRTYSVAGHEIFDGYGPDEMCPSGRGQILSPWPNRIQDGRYEFDGRTHQLPIDQVDEHNAIHGLVRWAAWEVAEHESHHVALEHVLHPRPGYPFSLGLRVEYGLSAGGLEVRNTATNLGSEPCPYGTGAHPYLTAGSERVDETVLRAPVRTVLQSNERGIPTGDGSVDGTEYDFRRPRPIGATQLDNCFTDLERDADGRARVVLRRGDSWRTVTVWMDEAYRYVMLFTGDPLPDVARRSIAVEPMTCPPNGFRTGRDVIRLEPGHLAASSWGIGLPT